jgi:tRNA modification GTPase
MKVEAVHSGSNRVCVLTPPGRAAVATVLVEGEQAVAALSRRFRPVGRVSVDDAPLRRIVYGTWDKGDAGSSEGGPGEGVVVCRTAPQRVEIHCHGGKAAVHAIVDALTAAGLREADWCEWVAATEPDPVAAQARIALAEARTQRTAAVLLDQYRGALGAALAAVEGDLEFQRLANALRRLDEVLQYQTLGLHLTRPWRVVLAGRPNVGKSSLINGLVGYRRSIVHDTPGVTRDVVTASTALDGWPVEFADTAGVRESDDPLESAGVTRTRQALQTADLVCLVFDAAQPWTAEDAVLGAAVSQTLIVHNKCDLTPGPLADRPPGIRVSAMTGCGLEELKQALAGQLAPRTPPPGAAVPFTAEQVQILHEVRRRIVAQQLAAAQDAIRILLPPTRQVEINGERGV